MGLVKESSRSHGRSFVPGVGRVFKMLGGRSILRTPEVEVKAKRVSGHETSFVAVGRLQTSADETADGILLRIVRVLVPSRTEQSDRGIARHGKEPTMDVSASFTRDNLPELSEESLRHLAAIKRRAADRKARRIASENSSKSTHPTSGSDERKAVIMKSRKDKMISLS